MSKTNDGGPAFPCLDSREGDAAPSLVHKGMSLRDHFAGQAVSGILSNSDLPDLFKKGFAPSKAAEICWEVADAMLAARDRPTPKDSQP